MPVLNDLHKVDELLTAELNKPEVIHDKQVGIGQLVEELGYALLYPCHVNGYVQFLPIIVGSQLLC